MPTLDSTSPRPREYWTLAAITLLAGVVRFIGLTRDSLWTDELFSGYASQIPDFRTLIQYVSYDVHPPGYFATLWVWARAFGDSDFTLRAFSALGGVLLVPLVFRLGRQLYDTSTALLAAFFAALLLQGVYYSQEVRAYIWMALFSALSVSLILDYVKRREADERGASWWLVLATIASIANSYYHYFGLLFSLFLLGGLCFYLARKKLPIWPVILAGVSLVLSYLPWIPVMIESRGKRNWIPPPTLRTVAETANALYGPGVWLVLVTVALVFAGLVKGYRDGRIKSQDASLAAWILIPLLVAVLLSVLIRPVYSPRNMMFAFAAGTLLLARAIVFLSAKPRIQWTIAATLILVLFGVHGAKGNGYLFRPVKQQVREAASFIVSHNANRLPIYAVAWDFNNFSYYLSRTDQLSLFLEIPEPKLLAEGLAASVPEREFWIASAGLDINLLVDLSRDYDIVERAEFINARAYRLRRKAK